MTDQELNDLITKAQKERNKRTKDEFLPAEENIAEEVEDTGSPESLKRKILKLEETIRKYEDNGMAKLYYSLNRKANEMADLMNAVTLRDLDIDDPKSKSFDRLKVIWQGASEIAISLTQLGQMAGIIKADKKQEEESKPFVDLIAQERK
jgi:Rad3-related DNA helicase